jgi:acetyl-CoA carboxylase, biotin carboxylase subunit
MGAMNGAPTIMFKKILIANRGEIAVRVIRTCRELGIKTVAVYSEIDRATLHVRMADEAYLIGPAPANESYLCGDKILAVAKKTGAEAIHPGYGFLSENADFSESCREAGIVFIGPTPEAMQSLGDKIAARKTAEKAGVAMVPGIKKSLKDAQEAKKIADEIGYPVMLKASAGGGGKGMRRVDTADDIESAFQMTTSEAKNSFGNPAVYVEKCVVNPHHIEIQILGDMHGNVIALGERDCSIQRRHQKVLEESPSPFIDEKTRLAMMEASVALTKTVGYAGAGTLEFLVDKDKNFYFLEMNARLQVEHPITGLVTGVDLVKEQLHVANGEKLRFTQDDIRLRGHALECRIYAEDPEKDFMPSPGTILDVRNPEGPGVRIDSAVFPGSEISVYYDPMISKLIVWGRTRKEMLERMRRALREYRIEGVRNNIFFHELVLENPDFQAGNFDTSFIEKMGDISKKAHPEALEKIAVIAAALAFVNNDKKGAASSAPTKPLTSNWKITGRREATHRET